MKNFIVCFDGQAQQISIASESYLEALKIALSSFKESVGKITVVEDPDFELLQTQDLASAAAAMGAKGGKIGGKVLSEAKIASNKLNAQKAGRRYEYVIFGEHKGKRVALGLGTARKKEKLLEDCKGMFVDCKNLELVLANKASKEELEAARRGTIITPECVIV